jgi:hypothetical protein
MSTKHACGPNCGDEPTPPAVAPTEPEPEVEVQPDAPTPPAPSHLTDEDREEVTRLFGFVPEPEPLEQMLAAVERVVARHRAEAIAHHARQHGCDETPALRERLQRERDMYEVDSAGLQAVCRALVDVFPASETMAASEAVYALAEIRREDLVQAWNEGHRSGCAYFPDCIELDHHDPNPYRVTPPEVGAGGDA